MTIASIDGSFALHRARFVAGKNGTPTMSHTVAIFIKILFGILHQFHPSKVYVFLDRERSYHRLQLYPDYKGHRKEDADDPTLVAYKEAREFLLRVLPTLGFITVLKDGIEADDFAYMIAHSYESGVHITDDRDWFGNLFPGWSLFRPKANELISYDQFCTLVSHIDNPRMIYLIARAIIGDKSDNIPGIRGISWTQALSLALHIFNHTDCSGEKHGKKVLDKLDFIRYNIRIMTPVWILNSEEALVTLQEAEALVTKDFSHALLQWKSFYDQLENRESQREMMQLAFEYNTAVRGFSYETQERGIIC